MDNLNQNTLDPRLKQIADILDKLKADLTPEEYDHAMADILYTVESRMPKKKKKFFGLF